MDSIEPLSLLALTSALFVGSHLLLSHPFRGTLVAKLGERGFSAAYSLVALITFGLMVAASIWTPPEPPLWGTGEGLWAAATLLMWFGTILFVGSFHGNPASPNPGGATPEIGRPRGVFAITRHPMNWSFAIWGLVHIAVVATPSSIIVASAIVALAIVGSAGQDIKKRRLLGAAWEEWMERTSFIPFAKGGAWPGGVAAIGGTALFLFATWLHQIVAPIPAGIWRWIG